MVAHDPVASEVAGHVFADLIRSGSLALRAQALDAVRDAKALVLVTEWPEYKAIPAEQVKAAMPGRLVLDGRNTLDGEAYKREGFNYSGIGRR